MSQQTPGTRFIALSGKKQTGKDTSAAIIVAALEKAGKKVAVTSFAEPLKRICMDILGLSKEGVYGTDAQKNDLSHIKWDGFPMEVRLKYSLALGMWNVPATVPRCGPMTNREVLQVIGTDVFRAIHDNVWAEVPFNRDWSGIDVVLLTDCRFPNEKKVTEDANGVIIRLERNTGFSDNHLSEMALDGFQFENTFCNNGSLQELETYLLGILRTMRLINE
jgi:hypothetical protein